MNIRLEEPWWLLAPALMLPLILPALWWFGAMGKARRVLAIALRLVLLAVLALILADAATVRQTNTLAVVAVVDVSRSLSRFGDSLREPAGSSLLARGREFLQQATAGRGAEDLLGVVAFDGESIVVSTPVPPRGPGSSADLTLDVSGADGTNIARAIETARALIPPDAAGRIVLLSDGNQTVGDAATTARELASLGGGLASLGSRGRVPIDVVPLEYAIEKEVFVESVDAPPQAAAGSTVSVRVVLQSTGPARGVLRLTREGEPVAMADGSLTLPVELQAGANVRVIEVPLEQGRVHRFEAVFEAETDASGRALADTLTDNNRASSFTLTPGRGSVLVVDGWREREMAITSPLGPTLERAGLSVQTVGPSGIPSDALGLQSFDLVILDNVPAEAVAPATQQLLADMVRGVGLGLVMVGGPDSLGAGGWKGTPIEPILPVKLDLPERLVVPEAAVVFVLDNSGSMRRRVGGGNRSQQEIANQAASLAVTALDKRDLVGVIVFNSVFRWMVPFGPNADPQRSASIVRGISSDGGTNLGPALSSAITTLRSSQAKVKHIIVLSDGKSQDSESLAPMSTAAAKDGIRISTISVGDDADDVVMERMALVSGGRFYAVKNPTVLPRVFLRAVRIVRAPLIREGDFVPLVTGTGSPLTAGLLGPGERPPPLGGLVLTQPRPEPTIFTAMLTPGGEPVLAHWNVELGQVAVFTSDSSVWAERWVQWPGYQRFWAQASRVLARPQSGRAFQSRTFIEGSMVRVRVEATSDDGRPLDGLDLSGSVYRPQGTSSSVRLEQTGPGVYEGSFSAPDSGTYLAMLTPRSIGSQSGTDGAASRLPPVLVGASVPGGMEFRQTRSNRGVLEEIAAASGGRVLSVSEPQRADLFDRAAIKPVEAFTPLARALLVWAVVLFVLDVANRRIAWDRWLTRERVAKPQAAPDQTIGTLRARVEAPAPSVAGESLVLGDKEAQELAAAQRDRRRRERLEAAQVAAAARQAAERVSADTISTAPPNPAAEPLPKPAPREIAPPSSSQPLSPAAPKTTEPPASDSPLLAAKRRVREKFEE